MKKIILYLLVGPLCLPLCLLGLMSQSSYGQESEVVMKTATGDLYGTLSVPENTSNSPVVLLIAGSGPTDRDGNNPMMKQCFENAGGDVTYQRHRLITFR